MSNFGRKLPRAMVLLPLSLLAMSCASVGQVTDKKIVTTENGMVRGVKLDDEITSYKGIPYATPPVGPLRWRAPQRHRGWSNVFEATDFGPACMQPERQGQRKAQTPKSEDCLSLNIWSPKKQRSPSPVMVWIHGGASVSYTHLTLPTIYSV